MRPASSAEKTRFWGKVDKNGPNGCWVWKAALSHGYGRFKRSGVDAQILAHRFAFQTLVGPVPDGLQLDHLCRNRACVNPAHLEPVTPAENARRGLNGVLGMKERCKRGHEFTPENTIMKFKKSRGYASRECRACARARDRERKRGNLDAINATRRATYARKHGRAEV